MKPLHPSARAFRPDFDVHQLALVPPYEKWALEILTHADYDAYWRHPSVDFRRHWDRIPDMSILLVGGWYDSYTRGTFQNFVSLGAAGRCAMGGGGRQGGSTGGDATSYPKPR